MLFHAIHFKAIKYEKKDFEIHTSFFEFLFFNPPPKNIIKITALLIKKNILHNI